jgi:hypothetical protein
MLLQTNSYIVPPEQRAAHADLIQRFRQAMARLGCDSLEVYEQAGPNWEAGESGRFVQTLRFRDREHQLAVQAAEREDPEAQALITEFCELINFPYQQQHGYFTVGFYANIESPATDHAAAHESESPTGEPETPYLDRDVDSIVGEFGAPTMRLAPDESEPEPQPAEDDFAENLHGEPANGQSGLESEHAESEGELTDLGQVLDAGMMDEELDVEMPAELLDEEEEAGVAEPAPPERRTSSRRNRRGPGGH